MGRDALSPMRLAENFELSPRLLTRNDNEAFYQLRARSIPSLSPRSSD